MRPHAAHPRRDGDTVRVLSQLFRGKFLAALTREYTTGRLDLRARQDQQRRPSLPRSSGVSTRTLPPVGDRWPQGLPEGRGCGACDLGAQRCTGRRF
jgi:hypothetical protein